MQLELIRGNAIALPTVKVIPIQCFIIYLFFSQRYFKWKGSSYEIQRGSLDLKLKVLVYPLGVKKDQRQLAPSPTLFPPNPYDKNFEIAILLKLVQASDNKNCGSLKPPGPLAGVVSYALGVYVVLIEGMLV